jgi:hypothetical protein
MGFLDFLSPGKSARKQAQRAADHQAATQTKMIQEQQDAADYASRQQTAGAAMNMGKTNLFDVTDEGKVGEFWKNEAPDINMADPFPSFLRDTGDRILGDIESAAGMISDFGDRYSAGQGVQENLMGMQDSATSALGEIYDGGLEDKFEGYRQDLSNLYEGLKGLNTNTASIKEDALSQVSGMGENFAQSLYDAHMEKAGLEGQRFGAETNALTERGGRYGDTREAQMARALSKQKAIEQAGNQGLGGLFSQFAGQGGGSNKNALARMISSSAAEAMVDPVADANVNYAQKMEGLNQSDVEAEHLRRMMEINPEMANTYQQEALMNNALRDLAAGKGLQGLQAEAKNIGLDERLLDNRQTLDSALMNMKLQNQGQIANQAEQRKYLEGVPTDLAMAESQALADYAGPFTARGQVSAPQTVFNTNPYVAQTGGVEPTGMEKFMNLMKSYQT